MWRYWGVHSRAPHPWSTRSTAELLRPVARFALTAVCLVQAWAVVFVLQLGPVVGTIDARAGRGVHSGDLLAVPLVLAALVLVAQGHGTSDHRPVRAERASR